MSGKIFFTLDRIGKIFKFTLDIIENFLGGTYLPETKLYPQPPTRADLWSIPLAHLLLWTNNIACAILPVNGRLRNASMQNTYFLSNQGVDTISDSPGDCD